MLGSHHRTIPWPPSYIDAPRLAIGVGANLGRAIRGKGREGSWPVDTNWGRNLTDICLLGRTNPDLEYRLIEYVDEATLC